MPPEPPRPRATEPLADALTDPIRRWRHRGVRRVLQAGQVFLAPGQIVEAFAYVERGLLQSVLLKPEGQHAIVERIGPGSTCAEGPCLHQQPYSVEMAAMERTELVLFDRPLMLQLFAEDPEFAVSIATIVALKYRGLLLRFDALTSGRPGRRLLELFERLGRMNGVRDARGLSVPTALTHADMAAMTGLSRVTVTRALARLQRTRRIERDGPGYRLLPPPG
jgi:CRP/FNR family cyclic AMP-dependent transcriptional regulator